MLQTRIWPYFGKQEEKERGLLPWRRGENFSMAMLCVPNKLGCKKERGAAHREVRKLTQRPVLEGEGSFWQIV